MTYLPAKLGPEKVENKPKIKPNQLNSAQNHHGPSLEDHKRRPNNVGLDWTKPRCGAPPALFGPSFGRLTLTASPTMVAWVSRWN